MTQPTIDPLTGKPREPAEPAAPAEGDFVPKADFDALRQRLDTFEQNAGNFGAPQPPPTPPAPTGPTFDEQITTFDTQISAIGTQIDAAVADGKPVSQLMRDRDAINSKKTILTVNREIEPKFAAGMQTIDYLSGEVTRGKMPYYDIVKKDIETQLGQLAPDQRMNPQVRQAAYQLAVGQNIDKIVAAKEEEVRRSAAADADLTPGGATGRTAGIQYSEGVPEPADVLGSGAMAALRSKGVTPDQEYQRRGYEGWEDYYNKVGKKYFGDVEGEA